MRDTLLGGLSPSLFLERHWQKQPLLIRSAIADFKDPLTPGQLLRLARRDDCETRLIIRDKSGAEVIHGPIPAAVLRDLPERNWTLLVQGINYIVPAARELLQRFSFLPYARLDDVMVSYAAPGGGVGPHFDSYDVFLLQGGGRRSWQVSMQTDLELETGSDLKLLKRFQPDGNCVLDTGDMLYLPPRCAHDGVALEACLTYSIGFRAPPFEELKTQFLAYLDDYIAIGGRYADPNLRPTRHPAKLGEDMVDQVSHALAALKWDRATVADFLGRQLTEPKAQIVLHTPPDLAYGKFVQHARARGIAVHPALPLLLRGMRAFINGEAFDLPPRARRIVATLADQRRLRAGQLHGASAALPMLHCWYGNGYICLGERDHT